MTTAAVEPQAPAIRGALRENLRERVTPRLADEAVELLFDAMRSKKTASGYCQKCRSTVTVQVADARAASTAFETLIAHTEGKASTEKTEQDAGLTIVRLEVSDTALAQLPVWLDQLAAGDVDAVRAGIAACITHAP